MSRTITAMFDTRADAEAAKARLTASHIDASHINIVDQSSTGTGVTGTATEGGFWHSLKEMFVADEDRHAYGEGIKRGGFVLSADVDEGRADEAVRILDETNSVDLDQRTADWRGSGWTGKYDAAGATGRGTEESIPVIEETLRVGKREVERGGARVRSYVREIPVNEQVSLREEHVSVERRPVDRPLTSGEVTGDMLRERTIEMRETAEEAVVGKEARVVEEVVVRKTADTRTETVSDTVRRTEVEVDNDVDAGTTRTAGSAGYAATDRGMDDGRVATGLGGTPPLDPTFANERNR